MRGTTPPGAASEEEAARWVRAMFGRVAPRYDFANRLLSGGIDQRWRKRVVQKVLPVLRRPRARVLDLCCGTGDLLQALAQESETSVIGSDFCHPMLQAAARKMKAAPLVEADALQLPFGDRTLDMITIAFGFRNLADYQGGLQELYRVLRPGGMLAILEFSQPPRRVIRTIYGWCSKWLLPFIGGAVSGARDAYEYLPASVRKFPDAPGLAVMMKAAGFQAVRFERLTFGVVAIHLGEVSPTQAEQSAHPSH